MDSFGHLQPQRRGHLRVRTCRWSTSAKLASPSPRTRQFVSMVPHFNHRNTFGPLWRGSLLSLSLGGFHRRDDTGVSFYRGVRTRGCSARRFYAGGCVMPKDLKRSLGRGHPHFLISCERRMAGTLLDEKALAELIAPHKRLGGMKSPEQV
jgi:hypothetical protein